MFVEYLKEVISQHFVSIELSSSTFTIYFVYYKPIPNSISKVLNRNEIPAICLLDIEKRQHHYRCLHCLSAKNGFA